MSINNEFFNDEILVCKYNLKKTKHYYKSPKLLPCHRSSCESCVLNELNLNGDFFCKFCSNIHRLDQTQQNLTLEQMIDHNLINLAATKIQELFENEETLTKNLNEKPACLDKAIEYIEEEMEIRFESIKLEIEQLSKLCLRKVKKIERSTKLKLRRIQSRTETIRTTAEIFNILNLLKRFKFIPNNKLMPNFYQIGYLNTLNALNVSKMQTNEPYVCEFEDTIKYPTSICANGEQILITDNQANEIFALDSNFKILNQITHISDLRFNGPRGISTNGKDTVFICDTGNDRVVISDINLKIVKRIIGRKGKLLAEFNWPSDVSYYNKNIFILDEMNCRIQQFTSSGDFIDIVYSKTTPTIERSNIFKKISVDNDLIAICNRYFVYIIDFHGNELQKLGNLGVQLKSIYLTDSCYLITHNVQGSIICYGRNRNNEFSVIFSRESDHFKKQTSSIIKFKDKLLFLCMRDNLLITL